MSDEKTTLRSRRRFLNSGAAFLAGGVIGNAAGVSSAASTKPTSEASAELPWEWGRIDPMEAGSRAFRYYHDLGG